MQSCLDMRGKIKDLYIVKVKTMSRLSNMIIDFGDTLGFENIIPVLTHSVFDLSPSLLNGSLDNSLINIAFLEKKIMNLWINGHKVHYIMGT